MTDEQGQARLYFLKAGKTLVLIVTHAASKLVGAAVAGKAARVPAPNRHEEREPRRREALVKMVPRRPGGDGVADRLITINVVHHINDDPAAMAEMLRLITPGGLFVCAEFARMERPVGPPNDHVLALDDLRATLTGLGLREHTVYPPGEVGLYHDVVVAEKPPA